MKWVLLDANNLIHRTARALYSSLGQVDTGLTMYGVLDAMLNIGMDEKVQSNRYAVFFDSPRDSLRKAIFPAYKHNRTVNIDRAYTSGVRKVFDKVRDVLPRMGFPVYELVGYEADDLIARAAQWVGETLAEKAVILTSDSDLHQCISEYVDWYDYSRNKYYNLGTFRNDVGRPEDVARVKAITGCSSDGIPGVGGVGEVSAWKYIRGEEISPTRLRTIKTSKDVIDRNLKLIALPLKGTPKFELKQPVYDIAFAEKVIRDLTGRESELDQWSRFLRGKISAAMLQKTQLRRVEGFFNE